MRKLRILFVLCLILSGCEEGPTQSCLPTGSINVKDLGNNWITFQVDIDGVRDTFLFHKIGTEGSIDGRECITKLSSEKINLVLEKVKEE